MYVVTMSIFGPKRGKAFHGNMAGRRIINVGEPTDSSDATTKSYVDDKAPTLARVPDTLNIATGSRWRRGASAKIVFGNELTYIKRNHGSREVEMTGDLHINATGNTVRREGELVLKQKTQIGPNRVGGLVFENTSTGHAYFCGYARRGLWGIFHVDDVGDVTQILEMNSSQINLLKTTNMNGQKITGLGGPTDEGDATTKYYVDAVVGRGFTPAYAFLYSSVDQPTITEPDPWTHRVITLEAHDIIKNITINNNSDIGVNSSGIYEYSLKMRIFCKTLRAMELGPEDGLQLINVWAEKKVGSGNFTAVARSSLQVHHESCDAQIYYVNGFVSLQVGNKIRFVSASIDMFLSAVNDGAGALNMPSVSLMIKKIDNL